MTRRAFTLMELMIVVALIGVLSAIVVVVGVGVLAAGKERQARDLLSVLDSSLTEFQTEYGSIPRWTGEARRGTETAYEPPRSGKDHWREVAVYLAQAQGLAGVDRALAAIDPKLVVERRTLYAELSDHRYAGRVDQRDTRLSIRDPWGMEVLYIHPYDRGDAHRAFGRPIGERPYFMSAGRDMTYGDHRFECPNLDLGLAEDRCGVADNLYSYSPEVPEP